MSGIATAVVGGSLISGYMGSQASKNAANTQADAARQASSDTLQATRETNQQQLDIYNQNVNRQQPWVKQGMEAANTLRDLMAPGGQLVKQFTPSDLNIDPSYQWRLQQGQQALQASAAARGQLMTGQGLKDIINYGQQAGSQEYQSAFDRFQTQNTNLFNRVNTVSTLGQNAAAGVGAQGTQLGANLANTTMTGTQAATGYMTGAANAIAGGQVGAANAWSGAIGGGLNTYGTLKALGAMSTQGTPGFSGTQAPAPIIDLSRPYGG